MSYSSLAHSNWFHDHVDSFHVGGGGWHDKVLDFRDRRLTSHSHGYSSRYSGDPIRKLILMHHERPNLGDAASIFFKVVLILGKAGAGARPTYAFPNVSEYENWVALRRI
jgi:hypothetical protein